MYSFISRLYKEFILWTPFFQSMKENAPTIITFSREPKSNHCYFQGRMNEWIIPSCRCKGLPSFKYKEHTAQNHKGWGVFSAPGTQDQGYSEVALKIISTANMSAHLSLVCDVSSKKKQKKKTGRWPHRQWYHPKLFSLCHHTFISNHEGSGPQFIPSQMERATMLRKHSATIPCNNARFSA